MLNGELESIAEALTNALDYPVSLPDLNSSQPRDCFSLNVGSHDKAIKIRDLLYQKGLEAYTLDLSNSEFNYTKLIGAKAAFLWLPTEQFSMAKLGEDCEILERVAEQIIAIIKAPETVELRSHVQSLKRANSNAAVKIGI